MSWLAHDWAEDAPVATVYERAILTLFAHRANSDGTDCYPSLESIAEFCLCDKRTAQRHLRGMAERGLIGKGDQNAAYKIPKRYRPTVWDLLIPYTWYSAEQLAKVNKDRERRGMEPLQPEDRPAIAPPPEKPSRSDKGKPNPKRSKKQSAEPATSDNAEGCLSDTPDTEQPETPRGDSETPMRGDSETSLRGDSLPPKTVPSSKPVPEENGPLEEGEISVRPSGSADAPASDDADGRTEEDPSKNNNSTDDGEADASTASLPDLLLADPMVKARLDRLAPRPSQETQIRAAIDSYHHDGWKPDRIRGYLVEVLAEAQTVTYLIKAMVSPEFRNNIRAAQDVASPSRREQEKEQRMRDRIADDRRNRTDVPDEQVKPVNVPIKHTDDVDWSQFPPSAVPSRFRHTA